MNESKKQLTTLILGVCHLCERTRELAQSESRLPSATAPVREALQIVWTTLQALSETWESESAPAPFPAGSGDESPQNNWLIAGEELYQSMEDKTG